MTLRLPGEVTVPGLPSNSGALISWFDGAIGRRRAAQHRPSQTQQYPFSGAKLT
jgi:hypothetical protein